MLEDKKFLYISSRQRIAVSGSLVVEILATGSLVFLAATDPRYANLLQPSVELLKLLLTGAAAWGLVVLYASANSTGRIAKETDRFFANDVPHAFARHGFRPTRLGRGREACLLHNHAGSALYTVSIDGASRAYLWCHLNVNQLTIVFLLNAGFAQTYRSVFQASLKGFASQGLSVESFGVQTHDADGLLASPQSHLELFVCRKLANDFLFDAAARYATAQSLYGDARSLVIEDAREALRSESAQEHRPVVR